MKHAVRTVGSWQPLKCAWDDVLIETATGTWRVRVAADALAVYSASRRFDLESRGVTVSIGGTDVPLSTQRGDDRAALLATYAAIVGGVRADHAVFKFADGRARPASNSDMLAAVLAAIAHVQHAFDIEHQVAASIESGAILTTAQIDAVYGARP